MCAMHGIKAMHSCTCLSMMLGDHQHVSSTHFGPFANCQTHLTVEVPTRRWSTSLSLYQRRTVEGWKSADFPVIGMFTMNDLNMSREPDFMNVTGNPKSYFGSNWGPAVPAKCCTHQAFSKGDRQVLGIPGIGLVVCGVPDLNRSKTKAVTPNSWWKMLKISWRHFTRRWCFFASENWQMLLNNWKQDCASIQLPFFIVFWCLCMFR